MNFLTSIPLADAANGWLYTILLVAAALAALWTLRRRWYAIAAVVVVTAAAWYLIEHVWHPFPDAISWRIYTAAGVALLSLAAAFIRRWMVAVALVAALLAAGVANLDYQAYPDVGSLDPRPAAEEMTLDEVNAVHGDRDLGAQVNLDLPGNGFTSRSAIAYLPPAYWSHPERALPVVVLIHGNPGGPLQWFGSGEAAETADEFQAANGGVSPIVVSVDGTGSETANPICVDSDMGKFMTYIAQDVPREIKAQLRVDPNQQHWTVGGLSYGGTCSLQVATNYPDAYGSVLDLSGQAEPTLGKHEETVAKFFGGSEAAFDAVDPAHLLKTKQYGNLQAVFIAGESDPESREALAQLSDAAQFPTYFETLPGGHSFQVWRAGLRRAFAWTARRGGLDVVDPFEGITDDQLHS